jgi:hypothetical protein
VGPERRQWTLATSVGFASLDEALAAHGAGPIERTGLGHVRMGRSSGLGDAR